MVCNGRGELYLDENISSGKMSINGVKYVKDIFVTYP